MRLLRPSPTRLPRHLPGSRKVFPKLVFPNDLNPEIFLSRYWQRSPLFMRQALPGFVNPLSADELGGLSCEPDVESRIVLERGDDGPWTVRHGPFDAEIFADLPATHWTLLVQDVDKHLPELAALLQQFRFLPDWRVDDIMISYAEDQGSVGPHVDAYDVFLIQAEGARRWQIDPTPATNAPHIPDLDLRILREFDAKKTYLLEPGDILYLPPGVPHWGVAIGACITWSVGLRAPAWREMATSWCERVIGTRLPDGLYRDPPLSPQQAPGEILPQVFDQIRTEIQTALSDASRSEFQTWLGEFLTDPKEHLNPEPAIDALDQSAFLDQFRQTGLLVRVGFSKLAFCQTDDGTDLLFSNGESRRIDSAHRAFLRLLTDNRDLRYKELAAALKQAPCLELLHHLYFRGHYEFP